MSIKFELEQFKEHRRRGLVLNFGPGKMGKTTVLHTLIKMGLVPIWVYDFDRGVEPFVRRALAAGCKNDDIRIIQYTARSGERIGDSINKKHIAGSENWKDFLRDFNELYDYVDPNTGDWRIDNRTSEKRTVLTKDGKRLPAVCVYDSWTAMQEMILDFVLSQVNKELGDPGTDGRAFYGKQMSKIQEVLSCCRGLPCLHIFNAHERLDKNDITGEIRIDPMVTGLLAQSISKEFDVVVYSTTRIEGKDVKYIWYTKPKQYVKTGGTRHHDNLPLEVEQDYATVL